MSIFETALNTLKNDFILSSKGWADRMVNANLAHAEYTVAQATYRTLNDVILHIEKAVSHIQTNPDLSIPETFLEMNTGTPDPEVKEEAPSIHTVNIESGEISQGAN